MRQKRDSRVHAGAGIRYYIIILHPHDARRTMGRLSLQLPPSALSNNPPISRTLRMTAAGKQQPLTQPTRQWGWGSAPSRQQGTLNPKP